VLEIVALRLSSVPFNAIITCDGAPAGMVGATIVKDDDAINDGAVELLSMWVSPEFRGRGVGDATVRAVIDWARMNHSHRPVVLSVKAANHHAIDVYPPRGFVESGQSTDGADELSMRREGGVEDRSTDIPASRAEVSSADPAGPFRVARTSPALQRPSRQAAGFHGGRGRTAGGQA